MTKKSKIDKDINNFQITKNFNLREFQSPDTQEVKISKKVVDKLQWVRDLVGKPLIVTSAYRTPEHNKKVGGVKNSQHPRDLAPDISTVGHNVWLLRTYFRQAGFKEVIIYKKKKIIHAGLLEK